MEAVFLKVLNMSINASWLIAAVMVLRVLLKRAPKALRCLLWGAVALRLVLPFSLESALSLIPSPQTLPDNILYTAQPIIDSGIPFVDEAVNPVLSDSMAPSPMASANPTQIWSFVFSQLWILGMVLMLGYALFSWIHVRRKVAASVSVSLDVRLCDYIDSPFILGLFRPVIYLPSSLSSEDAAYVMAHERSHLKRRDHWWKPLGFAILAVHWFNPLVWAAYILLCRDIELACDEKVIRELGEAEKKAYSGALLNCSIRRPYIAACPLAFGEVGVKQRIKSVLNYRKPTFWILAVSLVACAIAGICFFTEPPTGEHTLEGTTVTYRTDADGRITFITHTEEDSIYTIECKEKYPTGAVERPYRLFPNGEIRDAAGNLLHIQYISVTGLRRETATRLSDHYQYDPQTETFTLSPGSDSLDQLTLCSFPDIPQDNNLAALAGFGEEEICVVSLSSRIGCIHPCSEEEMTALAEFLSGFRYDPTPLSEKAVSADRLCGGTVITVAPENRKSHYLEEELLFSEDFSVVWTWSDGNRGLPYKVLNPEGLAEYFNRRTIPVKNDLVTAEPFATREQPHTWLRNVHADALEKILVSYDGDSFGRMTEEYYAQLEPILHAISEQALTPLDPPVFFSESLNGNDAISLGFYDKANYILVEIHWGSRELVLVTYPGADDFTHYHTQDALYWSIDSPELAALMERFSQTNITVTLLGTQQSNIRYGPSQVFFDSLLSSEGVEITIPRGWLLDFSTETKSSPDLAFQLRPVGPESGSINGLFFTKDTFAGGGLGCETKTVQMGRYPATGYFYDGSDQWTYLHIPGRTCDLVIEFDAWDWEDEYTDQVMDILATILTTECMAHEHEIRKVGISYPDRPKCNELSVEQNTDGTWLIQYFDADRNLVGELKTDIWGNPL